MARIEEVGSFNIEDTKLMVSDPTYRNGDFLVSPVKAGTWLAFVERIDWFFKKKDAFNALAVYHESEIPLPFPLETIEPRDYLGTIMVRSGQCSIFKPSLFPRGFQYEDHYQEWLYSIM